MKFQQLLGSYNNDSSSQQLLSSKTPLGSLTVKGVTRNGMLQLIANSAISRGSRLTDLRVTSQCHVSVNEHLRGIPVPAWRVALFC